ncbi:serine hydrolase domain-containing protein [Streptomyces sp. NPDC059982]|uniref:serine hydrolase domain-containing protein n=1 Tax=unclassified Streptomyces TaxID=2593676 RepID=UPI003681234B
MTMTTRKRTKAGVVALAALAMAATAFTGPAQAAPGRAPRDTASTAAGHPATQRAIDAAVAAGVPGITAEARDAGGVWKTAAGVGNLKTGAPRGKNDRFRIGGITNTFVATVLLQMEAEKKLSLDDSVERHLPGLVIGHGNDGSRITVRQLLNHTSGLFDYLADADYAATYLGGDSFLQHRYDTVTPQSRIGVALSHEPPFQPGVRHWYSTTNDVLAALVLEQVAGRSYEDEVRRRIINPLGLTATSLPGNGIRLPQPSGRGYSRLFAAQPDRIDDVTEMNASQAWGNGDIISSAADLNRFYEALMRGRLLPPQQLGAMKTTVENPDFPGSSYGLGIERLTTSCGSTVWYHDGGTFGWITVATFTEDARHQLTYNYNANWGAQTLLPVLNAEYCEPPARSR